MSSNEQRERRINVLEGRVTNDHLESIKNDELGDTSPSQNMAEALSGVPEEALNGEDAIDEEIDRREEKLEALGHILPVARRKEVSEEIEALQAAKTVSSKYRTNTPEALAARYKARYQ